MNAAESRELTARWSTPAQKEALRRALLQRIADRLAYARALNDGDLKGGYWSCCWLTYTRPSRDGQRSAQWLYPLCDWDTCPHWHHELEVAVG